MAKGNRTINLYKDDIWKDVFYNSVGTYVNVINIELSQEYPLEPLSDYIKIGGGYAFKTSEYKKSGVPIIRISDFNNEQIDISNCVYYDEDKSLSKYELNENDIIICLTGGTIAKLGIVQSGLGKLYMNQRVGRFDILDNSKFEKEYVYWIARSVQSIIKNLAWGAAIPNVSPKQIEKLQFSFPPINVQKQIIEFLNDLKNNTIQDKIYFNRNIENHIIELQNNNIALKEVNTELTQQLDLIKQLRQAFLREAMRGKLVKSTNARETGQQLLKKIKAEKAQLIAEKKIKAGKLQEAEVLDGLHFEISEHWVWCNLDDICFNITDGTHQTPQYTKSGRMFLSAQNVKPFRFMPEVHKFVSEEDYQIYIRNRKPEKGDLLIGRVGAGIGETAVIDQDLDFCIYVSVALVQPFKEYVNSDYLAQVFNSPYGVRYSKGNISSKGGSAGNFNLGRIRSFQIPLPPLHEQEQIVAKLEELMAFCDGLEQSIKESQGYNEKLLQQVLREALQPKTETKVVALESRKLALPLKTILGAHIVDVCNTTDFGRVKFQKLLFLTEYHCKIDFDSHYVQKTAGPHDDALIKGIESEFKRQRFFEVKQENSDLHRVRYTKLPNANQINSMFLENFNEESLKVNNLLMKMRTFNWEECEVIATIYAIWNNRLLKGQTITDESLFNDFMAWSARKSNFSKDFYKKLFWMKEENIIPDGNGWGSYVDKPDKKMA